MKFLVNLENTEQFVEVQLEANDTLESLKYVIEAEFSLPFIEQEIQKEGKVLIGDMNSLTSLKILNDDVLIVRKKKSTNILSAFDETMKLLKQNPPQQVQNFEKISLDLRVKQESMQLKNHYLKNSGDLAVLFNTDPKLAEAICGGDDIFLENFVRKRLEKIIENKKKEDEENLKLMNADPNDLEAQKKIEERIRLKNIDENLKMAQEYLPEIFHQIHMLYINIEINKTTFQALVDTGAQTTIMGEDAVKKCGLWNMIDTRYKGTAVGVGTSKILGVIHATPIKINDKFLMIKISVIENSSINFIFGLDNMRNHRCNIDLKVNQLIFPDAGININFLSDGELKSLNVDRQSSLQDFEEI